MKNNSKKSKFCNFWLVEMYEMKKLWRPIIVIFAILVAILAVTFVVQHINKDVIGNYGLDTSVNYLYYKNPGSYVIDDYKNYAWIRDKFGSKIDENEIVQLQAEEYPLLKAFMENDDWLKKNDLSTFDDMNYFFENNIYYINHKEHRSCRADDGSDLLEYKDYYGYDSYILSERLQMIKEYSNKFIAENPVMKENGITNYDEFVAATAGDYSAGNGVKEYIGTINSETAAKLDEAYDTDISKSMYEAFKNGYSIPTADAIHEEYCHFMYAKSLLGLYKMYKMSPTMLFANCRVISSAYSYTHNLYVHGNRNPIYRERVTEAVETLSDDFYTVSDERISPNYGYLSTFLFSLAICATIFMIIPYAIKDNANGTKSLLFTSKRGRKSTINKILAVISTSIIISTFFALITVIITSTSIYAPFYGDSISSFSTGWIFWGGLTMWQYIAISVVFFYITNAAFALFTFFAARFFGNIVSAVSISIPIFVAAVALYQLVFDYLFVLPESKYNDILWLVAFIIIGIFAAGFSIIRDKKSTISD